MWSMDWLDDDLGKEVEIETFDFEVILTLGTRLKNIVVIGTIL
jgi:hypothetical protein